MRDANDTDRKRMIEVLAGRTLLLLFGVGVLGFLVAINHADWFSIRPATGTSVAMARASEVGASEVDKAAVDRRGAISKP